MSDDVVERLVRLHPDAGLPAGVRQQYATAWQPQHAVPRLPAPYRPTDETIELQVARDLERIDRTLNT